MKGARNHLFELPQEHSTVSDMQSPAFIRYVEMFSSIIAEGFYIWDISQNQFRYIKPDNLFLCGFSVEEAQKEGADFYSKIVHPEDLPLWTNMQQIILQHLDDFREKQNEIDFFSCTFRLQRNYSFHARYALPQMIYHRTKPVWESYKLRYIIDC